MAHIAGIVIKHRNGGRKSKDKHIFEVLARTSDGEDLRHTFSGTYLNEVLELISQQTTKLCIMLEMREAATLIKQSEQQMTPAEVSDQTKLTVVEGGAQ
jgi:hypothetical protein